MRQSQKAFRRGRSRPLGRSGYPDGNESHSHHSTVRFFHRNINVLPSNGTNEWRRALRPNCSQGVLQRKGSQRYVQDSVGSRWIHARQSCCAQRLETREPTDKELEFFAKEQKQRDNQFGFPPAICFSY